MCDVKDQTGDRGRDGRGECHKTQLAPQSPPHINMNPRTLQVQALAAAHRRLQANRTDACKRKRKHGCARSSGNPGGRGDKNDDEIAQ